MVGVPTSALGLQSLKPYLYVRLKPNEGMAVRIISEHHSPFYSIFLRTRSSLSVSSNHILQDFQHTHDRRPHGAILSWSLSLFEAPALRIQDAG